MNDETGEQLVKQLKRLNFWVTTFGVIFLIGLAIVGFILFQIVMFVMNTQNTINDVRSDLDMKQKICNNSGGIYDFVKSQTDLCKDK